MTQVSFPRVTHLEVPLREGDVGSQHELVALFADLDGVTELSWLSVDLDSVVEELLEGSGVKDVVGDGDRVVDVELVEGLASGRLLGGGGFGLLVGQRLSD